MRCRRRALAAVLGMLTLAAVAQAQTPPPARVALVLEVKGSTTPALKAYREIHSGTTVTLAAGSRVVFLHYESCRTYTINGGSITFTAGELPAIQGAAFHGDVPGQCPRRVAGSGPSAVTVFRSVLPPTVTVSGAPSFVLVGRRAEEFVGVRVLRQGQEVLERPLNGPRFDWPAGTAPLAPGEYQVSFVSAREGTAPVVVHFRARGTPPDEADVTLITVD